MLQYFTDSLIPVISKLKYTMRSDTCSLSKVLYFMRDSTIFLYKETNLGIQ